MYDSRTHKPRRPGTNRYASRAWREQEDWEGEFSKPTVTADLALAEGLEAYAADQFVDGPVPECDDVTWNVSEFGLGTWLVPVVAAEIDPYEEAYDAGDLVFDEDGLLVLPSEPVLTWSSDDEYAYEDEDEDEDVHYGDPAERVDVWIHDGKEYLTGPVPEDLDEITDWTSWLPLMSYDEACEELAYGFTIEGPSPQPEPLREGHYVRVYQLARDLGVDSKPLVAHLREIGEYVATHQSWVANPVADRLRADNSLAPLAWALGGRTTATTGTQSLDALIREEGRRYAAHPVPPRPGTNPFAGLYR